MRQLLVAALLLPPCLQAQSAPFRAAESFFALSVANLDSSRTWYRDKLGLADVMPVQAHEGVRIAIMRGGGVMVELIENAASQARGGGDDPTVTRGFFKVGLVVDSFDTAIGRLRERGVRIAHGPFPARDGIPANAIITDRDGNLIQLFGR